MEKVSLDVKFGRAKQFILASLLGVAFGFSGTVKAESSLVKKPENIEELLAWTTEAIDNKELVVFCFSSKQCRPCVFMSPIIESLALEMKGRVRFFKICADNEIFFPLLQALEITMLPCFVVRNHQGIIGKLYGAGTKDAFHAELMRISQENN